MIRARRFATGLSSLWDRAAARLAALRFNPSRKEIYHITPEEDRALRRALMDSVKLVKRLDRK